MYSESSLRRRPRRRVQPTGADGGLRSRKEPGLPPSPPAQPVAAQPRSQPDLLLPGQIAPPASNRAAASAVRPFGRIGRAAPSVHYEGSSGRPVPPVPHGCSPDPDQPNGKREGRTKERQGKEEKRRTRGERNESGGS